MQQGSRVSAGGDHSQVEGPKTSEPGDDNLPHQQRGHTPTALEREPVRSFKAFIAHPRNKSYRSFAHYRAARRCFEFLLEHRELMLSGMRNANLPPLQAILVDFEFYLERECDLTRLIERGEFDHFKQMCGAMVRDIVFPEYEVRRHGGVLRLNRYFNRASLFRTRI